jgi:hypothetical protein
MKFSVFTMAAVLFLCVSFAIPGNAFASNVSLDGAWKPNNYGTRIEIDGDTMLILWMNRPQLETTFTVTEEDGKTVLHLEKTGLRERGDKKDYAQITGLWVEDGVMHFVKVFDIAGEKEELLSPTTESRYGNVTVVTEEKLPRLEGIWKETGRMNYTLRIEGEKIFWRFAEYEWEGPVEIAVVHYNWEKNEDKFTIRAKDPAREYVGHFTTFDYRDGKLHTYLPVYDADSPKLVFEKVE